ncbi:interleukin-12 subunit alpha [Hippoglossus hippoglossus]|uniref:interleukin-12 subunit alpha n=1 Tax=Hippoglossus hippoglossus TaxID=8267 RepID=UPI00148D01BD|nr:interleukin-12 subunit alpha [Hippoglossus hippoglossus]
MANFHFYLASCALLLTLTWRTSTGLPLRTDNCAQCALLFRGLLLNITELLDNDIFCYGIRSDKVAMRSKAETSLACAPTLTENPGCMMQRNSSFSKSECLSNIMKDLVYYDAAITSYLKSKLRSPEEEVALLSPTLGIIKSLKNCSLMPNEDNEENDSSEVDAAQMWGDEPYANRQEMCKMMRGFYVRTITINRAVGYITSGDHRE